MGDHEGVETPGVELGVELRGGGRELATLGRELDSKGILAATGPAGSVLWFHSKTLHASGMNLSSRHRRVLILSYNGVHNRPLEAGPRPDFRLSIPAACAARA